MPVSQGRNTVEIFAINGTGFKGNCSHSDANTGAIRVRVSSPIRVKMHTKWHDLLAVYGTIRDRHEEAAARLIVR